MSYSPYRRGTGNLGPAWEHFENGVALASESAPTPERAKKKYEAALVEFDEAIRLDPDTYYEFYEERAYVYQHLDRYEEEIRDIDKALDFVDHPGLSDPEHLTHFAREEAVRRMSGEIEPRSVTEWEDFDPSFAALELGQKGEELHDSVLAHPRGTAEEVPEVLERAIVEFDDAIRLDPNCS